MTMKMPAKANGVWIHGMSSYKKEKVIVQLITNQLFPNNYQPAAIVNLDSQLKSIFIDFEDFELFFRGSC